MTSAPPDFLDRTIAKAFGQQTAIDPRLPSVFEPRGFGLEAEAPMAATQAEAPRGESQAGEALPVPGAHRIPSARAAPGERPAFDRRAGREREPGPPDFGREPASAFETVEARDEATALDVPEQPQGIARTASPRAENAVTPPRQTAMLRPDAGAAGVAPSPAAATSQQFAATDGDDIGAPGTVASNRPLAAAPRDAARVHPPGEIAPQRHAVTRRELDARAARAIAMPQAAAPIQTTARVTATPQRLGDESAVLRPAPERGGAASRARTSLPPTSERRATPGDDGPAPQGALLPIIVPAQRAPFAAPFAPKRRSPPPDGAARETTPAVVNVTIGRVEVRAAAAPAKTGGEKREPRPLSLADYLKRRSER